MSFGQNNEDESAPKEEEGSKLEMSAESEL